jgi:hypothetical protein
MKLRETLYNINLSKEKFFNLKGKSYLTVDLLKINLYFKSFAMILTGDELYLNHRINKIKKYDDYISYCEATPGLVYTNISKINFINN